FSLFLHVSYLICHVPSSLSSSLSLLHSFPSFFFFNSSAPTEIYTLSLHDALPIFRPNSAGRLPRAPAAFPSPRPPCNTCGRRREDRKSTRLNSSHQIISYAVFCLKKKKKNHANTYYNTR